MDISILPADMYIVVNKTVLQENDSKILTMLYQPIIGIGAVNLYLTLCLDLDKNEFMSEENSHHHLMTNMRMRLSDIVIAREKLEAIGLIKSYFKEGEDVNTYIYEIFSPLSANEIFSHPILNIVLYNNVGKKEYERLINRFKVHFGNKIAVFHSALSESEKYDEYRKIRRGEVSIVIGARSAIFTPLKNIGIIIIDEEHSSTYKQEHNPRYNAIDVAIIRCKYHNAKVVLGSATPQIESYARGKKGYYELVSLTKRANNASLPNVTIVDMKNEVKKGNSLFSEILIEKMREKLENNEQVILFLNRRGFSSYQLCSSCGEVIKCPNCDITLTYHKTSGMNRCHYCGYAEKKKDVCPKCKNESLKDFGQGTEKVEEEIKKIFQSYRTVRMDIDTTTKKGAHEKIINSFLNHEYDILVGTQMIAKGLDFPLVSLVGVINADTILNFPDFRSSERTYQMLSQVSGRAGRGNIKGDVIIQTFNPDNYSIELSKTHNYVDFFNKEIKIRKDLKYPPYYFISLIKIGSKDYNLSLSESKKIANYIKENISEDMIVLGPSVSGVSRVNKIYYFQIIIKFRNKEKMREILNNVSDLENNNKVSISIDINPC